MVLLSRVFWPLIAAELLFLGVMFVVQADGPSNNGGREMGLFFFVTLPAVVLVGAAALFWLTSSPIPRIFALLMALAGPCYLAYLWGGNLLLDRRIRDATIESFRDPAQQQLAAAILGGDAARVAELARRAKLNESSSQDMTLLNLAVRTPGAATPAIVKALLEAGADPNLTNDRGWVMPLTSAISSRQSEVVAALLEHRADPNQLDGNREPAFYCAVKSTDETRLVYFRQMLDHGADLNAVNKDGQTALMMAAIFGNAGAMNLLLDRGADARRVDHERRSALDYVRRRMGESSPPPEMPAMAERLERLAAQ